jgi:polysaccharide export outer membrane protein
MTTEQRLPISYCETMIHTLSRYTLLLLLALGLGLMSLPAQASVPAAARSHGSGESGNNYRIGPGDILDIFVWQNPDLSQNHVPVLPDGRISTPLISNIMAAGKTPVQLAHAMDKALSEYIRSPRVTVIVSQALGALSQVQVIGQVVHPLTLPYHEGMTVLDAVLAAGGLTPYAAGNSAMIERKVDGKVQIVHVRLSNLIDDGELSQNRALKPGDVIVVPESLF